MKSKVIKDNVHGYISVPETLFSIIDSAPFQRLKGVVQTSYECLYPSSTHNRFVHSLGVYHLGNRLISELWKNVDTGVNFDIDEKRNTIGYTFLIACLLHDIGHAPFSHTTEKFFSIKRPDESNPNYLKFKQFFDGKTVKFFYLDMLLLNELEAYLMRFDSTGKQMERFMADYSSVLKDNSAKPHEKMSAYIGLKEYRKIFSKIENEDNSLRLDPDLFVRCITGTGYVLTGYSADNRKYSFFNAIISLLNSDLIDVDKLDYILRDCYMGGYESTRIDVERLIRAVTIAEEKGLFTLAYKKNAISVIENVIQANDFSKKWLLGHPVIKYDSYLRQKCICETFDILEKGNKEDESLLEKFFSDQALSFEGIDLGSNGHVFLINDYDLVSLVKKAFILANDDQKSTFEEYFDRSRRRHPIWKSEAEYRICFDRENIKADQVTKNRVEIIEDAFESIVSEKNKYGIEESVFTEKEYTDARKRLCSNSQKVMDAIRVFFNEKNLDLDLVILPGYFFSSGFKKLNVESVKIEIPDYNILDGNRSLFKYSDLVKVEEKLESKRYFYLYSHHRINRGEFVNFLLYEANLD